MAIEGYASRFFPPDTIAELSLPSLATTERNGDPFFSSSNRYSDLLTMWIESWRSSTALGWGEARRSEAPGRPSGPALSIDSSPFLSLTLRRSLPVAGFVRLAQDCVRRCGLLRSTESLIADALLFWRISLTISSFCLINCGLKFNASMV